MYCRVLSWVSTDVSEVRAASIIRATTALMMEAERTSETSVDIQLRTRQYIPEDYELHLNPTTEIHYLDKNTRQLGDCYF